MAPLANLALMYSVGWCMQTNGNNGSCGPPPLPYKWIGATTTSTYEGAHTHALRQALPRAERRNARLVIRASHADLPGEEHFGA